MQTSVSNYRTAEFEPVTGLDSSRGSLPLAHRNGCQGFENFAKQWMPCLFAGKILLWDGTNYSNLRLHCSEIESGINSTVSQSTRSQVLFGLYSCIAVASAFVRGPRSFW
jgi:hypothetical protein